jgi:hypothetical protein
VSNLEDVKKLDTYFPTYYVNGEVHNVRVLGDFLINPSYKGQLTIVDASRPNNLVEIGWDSLETGLIWDADPYLPSGIILATAKSAGLYVYKKPDYNHASWLEGHVTNGLTGSPLPRVEVSILGTLYKEFSKGDGSYTTGTYQAGTYSIFAWKEGYHPVVIPGIQLSTGQVKNLDIQLFPITTAADEQKPTEQPSAFPNPFSDFVEVEWPTDLQQSREPLRLQLLDNLGRELVEKTFSNGEKARLEHLGELPVGSYWLLLTFSAYTRMLQIVKKRA